MIYLASPYSHPHDTIKELRFQQVCQTAAYLMNLGNVVYCPIAHSHPISVYGGAPSGWTFWSRQDLPLLKVCDELIVLMLDGWDRSEGVAREIQAAIQAGIRVTYMSYPALEVPSE